MSIKATFTFDTETELEYSSNIEVITSVDDKTLENPFLSGTVITSGAANIVDQDLSTSYTTTTSGFIFVASGQPYVSPSGEIITFNFGKTRKVQSLDIYQNPTAYAVDYSITFDSDDTFSNNPQIQVYNSTNSGTISHNLSDPIEAQYVQIKIDSISNGNTEYIIKEVSGQAIPDFTEAALDYTILSATSNVEPASNLNDNNNLTFWQSNNSYPQEVVIDLGSVKNVSKFEYVGEDSSTYPTDYTIQTSLDNETYTVQKTVTGLTGKDDTQTFDPTVSARYVKWVITSGASVKVRVRSLNIYEKDFAQTELNEVRLKETRTDQVKNPPSLSASSTDGIYSVNNLSDAVNNYWKTQDDFTQASGEVNYTGNEYIQLSFNEKKNVKQIYFESNGVSGIPMDFSIAGSNDNSTYATIREYTGNKQSTFDLDLSEEENVYLFYRIIFTKSDAPFIRIDDMNFFTRGYTEQASFKTSELLVDSVSEINAEIEKTLPDNDIKYHVEIGNKPYWFDGSNWVESNGTFIQSNSLTTINDNANDMPIVANSTFKVVTVFSSEGYSSPKVKSLDVTYFNEINEDFAPENQIRIKGYLTGIPGRIEKPITIEIYLKRSAIIVDGETLGFALAKIESDDNGYFDFRLPITENATPRKAKWVLRVPSINLRRERYTPDQPELSLADWISGNYE